MHSMALKMTWYLMTYLLWIPSQKIKRVSEDDEGDTHTADDDVDGIDPFSDDSDSDSE